MTPSWPILPHEGQEKTCFLSKEETLGRHTELGIPLPRDGQECNGQFTCYTRQGGVPWLLHDHTMKSSQGTAAAGRVPWSLSWAHHEKQSQGIAASIRMGSPDPFMSTPWKAVRGRRQQVGSPDFFMSTPWTQSQGTATPLGWKQGRWVAKTCAAWS